MGFVHLHWHSTFSFLEAIGLIKKIPAYAKSHDMSAIAVTDYWGMYGAIQFYNAAKDAGIKPIVWVELGFVVDAQAANDPKSIGNIVLLAKNQAGYHNLLRLVTFANTDGLQHKPKIDLTQLEKYSDGVMAHFGGEESWFAKCLSHGDDRSKIREIAQKIVSILWPDHVFGEIQAQDYALVPSLRFVNEKIEQLAEEISLPCIVNNNFHYIKSEDSYAWEAALAIKDNMKLYDATRRKPAGHYHIMTGDEIQAVLVKNGYSLGRSQELMDTNSRVADVIDTKIELGITLFPDFDPSDDIKELYEKHKDTLVE